MNPNKFISIKYIFHGFFLISLVVVIAGCSFKQSNQPKNNNTIDGFSIQPREGITIKTENILENDIKKRLEVINHDSTVPIEVNNDSKNCDMAIFIDKNPCEITNNEIVAYSQSVNLEPQSFSDSLREKFANNVLTIKVNSANNEQIFQVIKDYLIKSFKNNPPDITKTTLVGDIMLARWVGKKMDQYGYDYPFEKSNDLFIDSDFNIANLESPFSETVPYNQLGMVFRGNPEAVNSLRNARINIVNLANNHFGNTGKTGMQFTFDKLSESEISYFGAGKDYEESHQALIKESNGVKFAFLGYSDSSITPASYASENNRPGLNLDNIEQMKKDVQKAKEQSDFVIISMHLGIEYQHDPNQNQIDFAHSAIDAGADLIYGHHPHVVQGIEIYNNKPIFYSLGNFVFDQTLTATKQGLAVKLKFMYNKIVNVDLVPVEIIDYAQTQIASESIAKLILETIFNSSKKL